MKKKYEIELAPTLAQRVQQLRAMYNMTVLDLAKATRFPVERIEAIESGVEIWLSVTDRAILARALRQVPAVLREVESSPEELWPGRKGANREQEIDELAERILAGETKLPCPDCGEALKTTVEQAYDFEGNPEQYAHAYCSVCPFALR